MKEVGHVRLTQGRAEDRAADGAAPLTAALTAQKAGCRAGMGVDATGVDAHPVVVAGVHPDRVRPPALGGRTIDSLLDRRR